MSTRLTYLLGFVVICVLLLTSFYLQYVEGIMPCPLCMLQRLCFGLLGVIFFVGTFADAKHIGHCLINSLSALVSFLGMLLAGRQIWLQHFVTGNNSECGASIQYMMKVLPIHEVAQKIFAGSAECTQRGWEFLYLDMAEWALICFVGFFVFSIYLFLRKKRI